MIETARLKLIPLDISQMAEYLSDVRSLEKRIGLSLSRAILTKRVRRAMKMKMDKMSGVDKHQHLWFTYWLIVIKHEGFGAGLIGFKGFPDKHGSTEVGYGIDPSCQNRGYMSESLRAFVDWGFMHNYCRQITATEVTNPASRRVLEKLGAHLVEDNKVSSSWVFIMEAQG